RQAGMAFAFGRANQADHVIRDVRVGGPDLLAVHAPAALHLVAARADRSKIAAGAGLAHADTEAQLTPRDARQQRLALLLGAEAQKEGTALAVRDPMEADRCSGRQQLLDHNVAFGKAAFVPA